MPAHAVRPAATRPPPSSLPPPAEAVVVERFTRRFGEVLVLDNLGLSIEPGEFVALLGRSGSGKTTLLRTLAGLDPADGQTVRTPPGKAVVFQEPRLLPWKRVWRNVVLGIGGGDLRAKAEAALAEVGLSHRATVWPSTLSGGEAQRVALARALVRAPQLLLMDEPFAALDALTRLRMHELVLDLWRRHSPSVLIVTHDVDEAISLADRVLVLDGGRIAAEEVVSLPRPREIGAEFQAMRRRLLGHLGLETGGGRSERLGPPAPVVPFSTREVVS